MGTERYYKGRNNKITSMKKEIMYIFIVTCGRSGSRLLAEIFDLSGVKVLFDNISDNRGCFYESKKVNAVNYFIDKERGNLEFNYNKLAGYCPEIKKIKNFSIQLNNLLENQRVKTVVIKDPRILYLIPAYRKIFRNSFFVHIFRDARDFVISENEENIFYHREKKSIKFLLKLWDHQMELVDVFRGEDWFYELKFEDLLCSSSQALAGLWGFLRLNTPIVIPEIDLTRKNRHLHQKYTSCNISDLKWLKKLKYVK